MGYPRKFERDLEEHPGYRMKVDLSKADQNKERTPHWHLYKGGERIGRVTIYLDWEFERGRNVNRSIQKDAENLTRRYSTEIADTCDYNRVNGADD